MKLTFTGRQNNSRVSDVLYSLSSHGQRATYVGAWITLTMTLAGCQNTGQSAGCSKDSDCKGDRVCENSVCAEGKSAARSPTPIQVSTALALTADGRLASPQPAPTSDTCMPCSTQEDFDAAMKVGRKCCPIVACRADAECSNSRVCCRIPNGQLCTDSRRCSTGDRVQVNAVSTTSFPCGGTRCATGQLCCPGAPQQCASKSAGCGDGSETTVGFECDSRTNEPCGSGALCRVGKIGRSPMTVTSSCQKR